MYNLNMNVNANPAAAQASAGLLSVATEVTPRTPEIVNSLIAMTNPFDGFNGAGTAPALPQSARGSAGERPRNRSESSSGGEPSPPSIQHTCSQLIKEGLKLTLQTKRRANGSLDDAKKKTRKEDGSADDEEDDESANSIGSQGLTPEDEERRRRRRERNKIAATKCRLKKREKTVNLVHESESLETQNHVLKSQIQELETQRRRLVDMLNLHGPTCIKQTTPTDTPYQQFAEAIPSLPSYQENFVPALPNQTADCAYGPVKLESYDPVQQLPPSQDHFFRQQATPYTNAVTATTTSSDCAV
ncbi:activating transcription factor 3 isoform X2 [Phymastichus coffea]|uniref:activating transcription factor 3 isoform X2 n=1 Tax=Phymastichus coffea TaxID=108790 RepID=UPI00273C7D98|nr:activating transcription factor 3 isoform X2 [Phymastichus coffea]